MSMTRIDQRILIPAAPQSVWEFVSEIENLPNWHVNCQSVAFLSQKHTGPGTRWRQRSHGRQEFVYEMTTWYEGLGFEYVFVDGSSFQEARGRLRLQEIAEGTIVQWTFEYELGGVFSGIRDTLTTQRSHESDMVNSLKELWKQSRRRGGLENYQAKSLMRDGEQDPERRSQYRPRHQTPSTTDAVPSIPIEEPPVSDEDTRPRPAVDPSVHVPDEAPASEGDARFAPPAASKADTSAPPDTTLAPVEPASPAEDEPETPPAPEPAAAEVTEPDAEITEEATVVQDLPGLETSEAPSTPAQADLQPTTPPNADTSDLSIWEIFGIPSPTDTQKMRAVQAAEQAEREYEAEQEVEQQISEAEAPPPNRQAEETEPSIAVPRTVFQAAKPAREEQEVAAVPPQEATPEPPAAGRTGWRIRSRRRQAKVRRP